MTGTLRSVREKRERTRLQQLREDAKKLEALNANIAEAEATLGRRINELLRRGFTYYSIAQHLGRTPKEVQALSRRARKSDAGA